MLHPHVFCPHFTGSGPREDETASPTLELVGAAASHMSTELENEFDSIGAYAGEAVMDLPLMAWWLVSSSQWWQGTPQVLMKIPVS